VFPRLFIVVFWIATALTTSWTAGAERLPNVVLILADDLGYGELGCYGQKRIKTPRIDGLAAAGIRFTQFYAGQAVCAPSRCTLLTGKHMGHAAIRDNANPPERRISHRPVDYFPGQIPLPSAETTLAELLKSRDYATAAIGKWGLGYEGSTGQPDRQGFDRFYGYLCQVHAHNHYPRFLWNGTKREFFDDGGEPDTGSVYAQDRFTDEALEFIRAHRERPFFLYLAPIIPHLSIQVPDSAVTEYRGLPEAPYDHRSGYRRHPAPRAGYAAMVSYLDRDVGRIVDLLAELGLTDSTLILFTSDNGPTYDRLGGSDSDFFDSSGPLRGRKGSLWEGGIRVPLVAAWPGHVQPGTTSDHIAAFWDVLPTICELAAVQPPDGIDGQSFLGALTGDQPQTHKSLYWEFRSYGGQQAVRLGKWKAIRRALNRDPTARFQLFDLDRDISESHDVSGEHPEIIAEVEQIAKASRTPSVQFPFPALDEPEP
jgi:arylsulfatase A